MDAAGTHNTLHHLIKYGRKITSSDSKINYVEGFDNLRKDNNVQSYNP